MRARMVVRGLLLVEGRARGEEGLERYSVI